MQLVVAKHNTHSYIYIDSSLDGNLQQTKTLKNNQTEQGSFWEGREATAAHQRRQSS